MFSLELEQVNPLSQVKLSDNKIAVLQKATEHDPVMQTLKSMILIGWPQERDAVPISIREYWNFREYLTLQNGILFKSERIIVPKALRPEIISRLHSSHQGIESCLCKARDRVYWPAMNTNIKEAVTKCEVCAEFQARNASLPMQTHPIPDRPWSRVAADLFTLNSKGHIVLVDYYSDYIEVSPGLKDTKSPVIIKFLKQQFSRHGIPDVLVTDNGPQFVSKEFEAFTREWEFKHVSSSPNHAKSNGKAESAVKIAKNLFKKALKDNQDPWLALLDYRNTQTAGMQSSPVQRLMSRRTKTRIPTAATLLQPEVSTAVTDKIHRKRQVAKSYHDRKVRELPDLDIGQEVQVAPYQHHKTWETGVCVDKLSDRSYLLQSHGQLLRRNREDIKPATPISTPDPPAEDPPVSIPDTPPVRRSQRVTKRPTKFNDFVMPSP